MISYVKGILGEVLEQEIVVEAGGIGYGIQVPVTVLDRLPGLGKEVKIYTYMQVREDGLSLFGFLNRQDLLMFRQLIGVSGIGPKGALGVLSALSPDTLRMAVLSGDAKTISKAPGVGNKTAQRIILDLKDKVKAEDILSGFDKEEEDGSYSDMTVQSGKEAVEALVALGYSGTEAAKAVRRVEISEGMTAEDVLRQSLKFLSF